MADDRPYFSKKLEELIAAKGFSQNHLAKTSGVDQSNISKMIAGTISEPTLETVRRLAAALGVQMGEFIDPHAEPINPVEPRPAGRPMRKPRRNATS